MPHVTIKLGEPDGVSLRLHYLVEGQGPPVMLVHGLGGFAENWRHNLSALGRRFTTYAIDLPGFGQSDKPRVSYRLPFFARVLDGFAEALQLEKPSLVGHSLGGAVVVAYVVANRWNVGRVALVAPVIPGFGYHPPLLYQLAVLPGVGELGAACASRRLIRWSVARCFVIPDQDDEVDFLVDNGYELRRSAAGRYAYLSTLREVRKDFRLSGAFYRDHLASLDLPILLVHGREDRVVRHSHSEAIARRLRRGRLESIADCGHFPQIECAEQLNRGLVDFLLTKHVAISST
jgi:pimeloyl-ACP methyl ester carboxylesterase